MTEEPRRFTRDPEVIWDEVDGVMTLCHLETNEHFQCNEVGALIWRAFDNRTTVDDLVDHLAEVYPEEEREFLAEEVASFMASLQQARLVRLLED
jgi:hypothetical protein